ncbi:hypothetical protein P154DRAFT_544814 [Amniculicola lignicola CBS 123094]|uniref:Uncharacterized protein n=1 Tax=Amniculicola lignicola CBS 123094 TaxID=1392246 RepID=A0A6A5WSA5_9PLEO|nr:hypothetical protein P154DRAFT_544814 [Amniculicola lignicola CBS 123094]
MGPHWLRFLGVTVPLALLCSSAHAAVKPFISSAAEYRTECKTCPRSLCPNKLYYEGNDAMNVTCWTRGTKIMGDNLWLKTGANCYITQYDILEYEGDYTEDLKYCGRASEEQDLTLEDGTLRYKTECRVCPELSCDPVAFLPEETDLTLTCWTNESTQVVIDDPYWLKTTNNCYVAQIGLYDKPDITYLDNCGPIPFLELLHHYNENGTSDPNKRSAEPLPAPAPEPIPAEQTSHYLVNVTVGEEYAYCRSCPEQKCKVEKRYEFQQEVWLQCIKQSSNGTYWAETTDFCYVDGKDIWEDITGDFYRIPQCSWFEDPGTVPADPEDN